MSFRGSRWIFRAFVALLLSQVVAAQVKWTVPHLEGIGGVDRLGSGNTHLSAAEMQGLRGIVSGTIHKCLAYPGTYHHTASGLFNDLRIKRVNLGPDGKSGLAVQGAGLCMCSPTGNCALWIVAERPAGLAAVLQTWGIQSFAIQKTTSHGHFDVVLASHDSAWASDLSLYRFTGSYYRRSACAVMSYQGDHFRTRKEPEITPVPCRVVR